MMDIIQMLGVLTYLVSFESTLNELQFSTKSKKIYKSIAKLWLVWVKTTNKTQTYVASVTMTSTGLSGKHFEWATINFSTKSK